MTSSGCRTRSGFLFSEMYVGDDPIGIFADIFEYNFASQQITQVTHLPDEDHAVGFSISPDGQQIVFERAPYPDYSPVSVWIISRNGQDLHKLADDAGAPAWGQVPLPLTPSAYVPMLVR